MDEIFAHDVDQIRDPSRRWLRNTYQEGPGFRFLATRGGRPPGPHVRSLECEVVRRRARLVRVAREQGIEAAMAVGLGSRRSIFRWQAAYIRGGLAALVPGRRGPRRPLLKHAAWVEQVVIAVRLHTYWNAKRISAELRRRDELEEALVRLERLRVRAARARVTGSRVYNPGWHLALDLNNLIGVSEAVTRSALVREESRGGHTREDFPKTDAEWGTKNVVVRRRDGRLVLTTEPIAKVPAEMRALLGEDKPTGEAATGAKTVVAAGDD